MLLRRQACILASLPRHTPTAAPRLRSLVSSISAASISTVSRAGNHTSLLPLRQTRASRLHRATSTASSILPRARSLVTDAMADLVSTPGGAKLIDGTALAKEVRARVAQRIAELKQQHSSFQPHLCIMQVGSMSASSTYIRMKKLAAEECGMRYTHVQLPEGTSEAEIIKRVGELNDDISVDGILVQLPLGDHIDSDAERRVTEAISPEKDVDGFHALNIGHLSSKACNPLFLPCTPAGCIKLLERAGITNMAGLRAVVIGRSDIVGNPVASLLRSRDCTVTQVHSKTRDLQAHLAEADIVIAAMGKPQFVQGSWLKQGAVVIDVGTNFVDDASKKSGYRLVGDVEFEGASKVASAITPVPGGVGPMTVAMLMENVLVSAERSLADGRALGIGRGVVKPNPLKPLAKVPSDIEVARAQTPKPITQVAREIGLLKSELEPYGAVKAKVSLDVLKRLAHRKNGKYIVVAGITPTPLGEGKSTTTIGLAQALGAHLGKAAFACVRQPSQGPTFGIKGGAAGGGYSQVIPMEEFNLHLTGDNHAVQAANNLLAAAIDARMFHEATQKDAALFDRLCPRKKGVRTFSPIMFRRLRKLGIDKTNPDELTEDEKVRFARLDIDPESVTWHRVTDTNDRYLREITTGQAPTEKGITRKTAFDIAVASECMAVLALSTDLGDMRERLGRMVIGTSKRDGAPVTADDIGVGGALTILMKDAIKPNLMQTLEGTPVFVHAGPFANIAHGNSSILADAIALKLAGTEEGEPVERTGYVITEAGFGADIGMEKFCNIKCRESGLVPDAAVIVATVRALKTHGGGPDVTPGKPLSEVYLEENLEILEKGCVNLAKHISNAKKFGLKVIVAVNQFTTDTQAELELVARKALEAGADAAVPANHWAHGGAGAVDLAKAVIEQLEGSSPDFKLLYPADLPVADKIETIAKEMYGAAGIELSDLAKQQIATIERNGMGANSVCMAKTHLSFTDQPSRKGAPTGFTLPIREVYVSNGAGLIVALCGTMTKMPGLSTRPGFFDMDIDADGNIVGLS
ncbi:FTHFS-domain-containing protein [Testicularia cyperi]|uniref:C-1-tetrahydrofolate synthase, cytoplasmic n=1 Tax=Testicularia cyperi TaxID=1882483 RepID=A0A317XQX5_9BASI|nr:FTHFS-domain-containing protein [Testicularia cyperi]